MSNIKFDTKTKLGPFYHKGGLIALSSPNYDYGGTGQIKMINKKLNLEAGWCFNVRDDFGIIILVSNATRIKMTNEKEAAKQYDRFCRIYKWRKIWRTAVANMPDVKLAVTSTRWVKCPVETIPLPDFVRGNADGEMKAVDGVIYRKVLVESEVPAAKQALLARLMGYTYVDAVSGRLKVNSMSFSSTVR